MLVSLSHFVAVAVLGVRTLPSRIGSALMTLIGIAGVVAALLVVLSIAVGLESVMAIDGAEDTVVIMQGGSDFELASSLEPEQLDAIAQAPGLAAGDGGPLLSEEIVVVVDVPKLATGTDAHIPLRGVGPAAPQIRNGFRIVDGRMFEPGKRELIVGSAVAAQYEGLAIGSEKRWGEATWRVVGKFASSGSVAESELWGDVRVLQPIYGYGGSVDSVHARLDSAAALPEFQNALTADVRANVRVDTYQEHYGKQSATLTRTLRLVGGVAGLLMAICAAFGALNTMYAAVAARSTEIATLRALGFAATPTVVSVLVESMVVAAIGGVIGIAIAYVGFDGLQASTMNWSTYTQVAFSFQVNAGLAAQGLGYALVIGFVGGLLPAVRAATRPIAAALREA